MKFLFLIALLPFTAKGWIKEMENKDLYQGDMILTPDQMQAVREGKYSFGSIKDHLWPHTIPYQFDTSISYYPQAVKAIEAAIADYHKYTCLRFVPRSNQKTYMHFYQGNGCNSYVGMQKGRNWVSLANGCWGRATAIHEIGHSLGFHHEQSRPDRDNHLYINWGNIYPAMRYNFDKAHNVDSRGTPYDYFSVMHYGKTAFGMNGAVTMQTTDPYYQDLIGTGSGMSEIDIQQVNLVYKCPAYNGTDIPIKPTPECHDFTSYCEMLSLQTKDYCQHSHNQDYCPITCDQCTPGKPRTTPTPPCEDLHPDCSKLQFRCTMDAHRDWMTKTCKKTCHLCPGDPPLPTPTTAQPTKAPCRDRASYCPSMINRCKEPNVVDWMKKNCPVTCHYCPGDPQPSGSPVVTSPPEDCRDKASYCPSMVSRCKEAAVLEWVKRNCRRTCNYC